MRLSKKGIFKALPLILVMGTNSAYAVDFHGYVRGGVSTSTNGEMKSYRIGNLGRFGNEVDGYYDIALEQDIYQDETRRKFTIRLDAEGNMGMKNNWESVGEDNPLAITQYYLNAENFIPSLPGATFWVGKRNFNTRELQMFDYKLIGIFGPGAGIEDIDLGEGELSITWIRNDATADIRISDTDVNSTLNNTNILDFRYSGISLSGEAKGEFVLDYGLVNTTDEQEYNEKNGINYKAEDSLQASFIITVPLSQGFNETFIQYADKGFAANLINHGYMLNADSDYTGAKGFRVVNYGEEYLTDNIIANHAIAYGYAEGLGNGLGYEKASELSIAFRPEYIWDKYNKSAVELSWFRREETSGSNTDDYQGNKVTVAHVVTIGESQFVRPEVRLYSTYMHADDENPFADNRSNQLSFGIQMEAWW